MTPLESIEKIAAFVSVKQNNLTHAQVASIFRFADEKLPASLQIYLIVRCVAELLRFDVRRKAVLVEDPIFVAFCLSHRRLLMRWAVA